MMVNTEVKVIIPNMPHQKSVTPKGVTSKGVRTVFSVLSSSPLHSLVMSMRSGESPKYEKNDGIIIRTNAREIFHYTSHYYNKGLKIDYINEQK